MEFRVLGPLQVLEAGRVVPVDAPRQRALLAALLVNANVVVSTDRLLDAVWGEDPPGVGALHYQISKLRDVLQPGRGSGEGAVIVTRSPGYVLEVTADQVDALGFEALLGEARELKGTDATQALKLLDEALSLWRGSPYGDLGYHEFAHLEVLRLEELHLEAMEDRFDALIALGREREVVGELQTLVAEHPRRERLTGALMVALYRSGRQADALAAFQTLRGELGEGLGIEPSRELVDLEERILLQDETLTDAATARPEYLRGYALRGRIGQGAHGVVWRAAQPGVGREVAIKAIRPELANRPEFVRRFEAEAQLVAALEHPHIVSLFDFWRDPEGAYLVMPYLRGGSLADRLTQSPLEPATALGLLQEIGAALTYAHRRGVVHRDVTPNNVLLDDDGNAYLADFGVAVLLGHTAVEGMEDTPSAAYLSPELLAGEAGTPASDVFSLGILTEAMITNGALSPDVTDVVSQATQQPAEDRYASIDEFLNALAAAMGTATEPVPVELRNPYKGLRAFGEADAPDFFGRDQLVSELIDVVGRHRLVGVVGPSGCGKSSLVRAGLIPQLRRGALPGSDRWLLTDMYPGARPYAELEAALLQVAVERPRDLETRLRAGDWPNLAEELLPQDGELILVIDQFEELFTVTTDADERRRFLDTLVLLTSDPRHRVRIVVTMRADFYDRPLEYPEFADVLRQGLISVSTPGRQSMIEAAVAPASAEGLELEPGLADTIVGDVVDQPGGLPLLEYALTELFRHRTGNQLTTDGYHRTGGVLGALGTRAEELYQQQTTPNQDATRQIFLRLVTVTEGAEDTRRRIPLTELHNLGIDHTTLQPILDTYVAHRLLTLDRDPETREPTVEVAHEALLTRWNRLHTWIDDRRDDLVLHRRLTASLAEWHASGEQNEYLLTAGRLDHYETFTNTTDLAITADETQFLQDSRKHNDSLTTRQRRRRQGIMAGFAVAAVIAAVLAVAALLARSDAVTQRDAAEAATNDALEQRELADSRRQEAEDAAARAAREASVARARDLASSAVQAAESDPLLAVNLAVLAVDTLPEGEGLGPALETALRTAEAADRSAGRYEFDIPGPWTLAHLSPDGSRVAVVNVHELVVLDSTTLDTVIWSYREPGPDALSDVAYSSDGEFIVASVVDERSQSYFADDASDAPGAPDPRLLVFEADTGELVHTQPIDLEGACQASPSWSSDLGLLGLGIEDCNWQGLAFQFIDTTTWEVVYEHPDPPNDIAFVDFAGEGTLAAMFSGFNFGPASWLIDTTDWSTVRELDHTMGALSPDGRWIAGHTSGQSHVVVEAAVTGDVDDRYPIDNDLIQWLEFSPAGEVLVVATPDSMLLFDPVERELIDTLRPSLLVDFAVGDDSIYVSGVGVVSKWEPTLPTGMMVARNSIWWTTDGTLVADAIDAAREWSLYPVDSSTGELGEPIPYGPFAYGLTPITDNRAVIFRVRERAGVQYHGPLEFVDLTTGKPTPIAGCWMEVNAARNHEPCPNGEPHPAGVLANPGSKTGTEFMIFDRHEPEDEGVETFVTVWDVSTRSETSRISLGELDARGLQLMESVLTDEHLVLINRPSGLIRVLDRVTQEILFEGAVARPRTEHDRAQNRIWIQHENDTEVSLLDLDTLELRPVTGFVASAIGGLAGSPSGDLVAVAAGGDGFVHIYTDEGELRHAIPLPNPVDAWWLNEQTLVVATGDGLWKMVDLDPVGLVADVRASLSRGFTEAECSLYKIDPCPSLEELKSN